MVQEDPGPVCLEKVTVPDTKVNHILAKLDGSVTEGIMDILEEDTPVTQSKYDAIKNRLCRIYELTPEQRADRMLDMSALGDRRPTELMQEILKLVGKEDINFLIKHVFMRCLPNTVRTAIGNEALLTPMDLAELAEKHWLNDKASIFGNATASVTAVDKPQSKKEKLPCRFHKQWGEKANKCNPKCTHFTEFLAKKRTNQKQAMITETTFQDQQTEAWEPTLQNSKNF